MDIPNLPAVRHYQRVIQELRRNKQMGESAPHKPILLLTILDHFSTHSGQNIVPIDEQFIQCYHRNWRLFYSGTAYQTSTILPPLHHLSDGLFWELWDQQGKPIDKNKGPFTSETALLRQPVFGSIDRSFFRLLQGFSLVDHFRKVIIDHYFPYHLTDRPSTKMVERNVTYDTVTRVRRHPEFRELILQAYDYTCAISGLRTQPDHGLLEAAHIVPHAETFNNNLENGIALNPILHTAFDRGYLSISEDYRVLIHPTNFSETTSPHGIRQFEGKQLHFPQNIDLPHPDYLARHRNAFGF